jgi:MoaA/NifB/PqqE/SkfB family radical SAM enzyme
MNRNIESNGSYHALKSVNSIDLYVNYVCGLRCNHCFIGELLNSNVEIPFELVTSIIDNKLFPAIKSVTLLGGEPTLYSKIIQLLIYLVKLNIKVRIVTNGQKSYQNLIKKLPEAISRKLHICFSIDGSNEFVHDFIRGKGTFLNLSNSIEITKSKNISFSGITSISKDNYHDITSIISLCSFHMMNYLNIHYVTDRGFAERNKIVSIEEWLNLCDVIEHIETDIPIRLEKTFIPITQNISCEVVRKKNIIIDPLGNIYGCTMFMNLENTQTAKLKNNSMEINMKDTNENCICVDSENGCPAMPLINNELVTQSNLRQLKLDCIFNKTTIHKPFDIPDDKY